MSLRHNRRIRRAVYLITCVSLAFKFLIPVGYMPAPIGDGWPVRMCFTGLPASLVAHDDHHEHSKTDELQWESCSFAVFFSAYAITSDYASQELILSQAPLTTTYVRHSTDTTVFAFHSRAPPTRVL
jgi:hypothetical protein